MGAMASQVFSLTIVYSTVYLGTDQRRHQSSASLTFVGEFPGDRWIPRTKGQERGKCFHLMTSSCIPFIVVTYRPWIYNSYMITYNIWITYIYNSYVITFTIPDSKVHGANMGPTWVLSAPDGSHVDPGTLISGIWYFLWRQAAG